MPAPMNKYVNGEGRIVVMQSDKAVVETEKNGKFKRVDDTKASNFTQVSVRPPVEQSADSDGKPAPTIIVPKAAQVQSSATPVATSVKPA